MNCVNVLFVNEGDSQGTRGQGRFEAILRRHVPQSPGVSAAFVMLRPLSGRWLRMAGALAHPLWRRDLDFQTARWHAVQALRARSALAHILHRERPDVLHIHPHTAALALGEMPNLPPFLLSVDAEIWDWRQDGDLAAGLAMVKARHHHQLGRAAASAQPRR